MPFCKYRDCSHWFLNSESNQVKFYYVFVFILWKFTIIIFGLSHSWESSYSFFLKSKQSQLHKIHIICEEHIITYKCWLWVQISWRVLLQYIAYARLLNSIVFTVFWSPLLQGLLFDPNILDPVVFPWGHTGNHFKDLLS